MILRRSLHSEILRSAIALMVLLTLLFLSNTLMRLMADRAAGKISSEIVALLVALELPKLIGLLLPCALYLSIFLCLSRLSVDTELAVLYASGVGKLRLFFWVLGPILLGSFVVAFLSFFFNPLLEMKKNQVFEDTSKTVFFESLVSETFQRSPDGRSVVYIDRLQPLKRSLHGIFVGRIIDNPKYPDQPIFRITVASRAQAHKSDTTSAPLLILEEGARYEGSPGMLHYRIMSFDRYSQRMDSIFNLKPPQRRESAFSTEELWHARHQADVRQSFVASELHWRLAAPLSVLILSSLAFFLGHLGPRDGRYSKLLPVMLLYMLYMNGLILSRSWIEEHHIPGPVGLWPVHGLMLGVLFWLSPLKDRYFSRKYRGTYAP